MRICLSVVLLLSSVVVGQEATPPPRPRPQVIDPAWRPKPGDQAVVSVLQGLACRDYFSCTEAIKFAAAGDKTGIDKLVTTGRAGWVPRDIPVLVLVDHGATPDTTSRVYTGAEYSNALITAALSPRTVDPIEVRVLDGPLKGQVRFFSSDDVGRLIDDPSPTYTFKPNDLAILIDASIPLAVDESGKSRVRRGLARKSAALMNSAVMDKLAFRVKPETKLIVMGDDGDYYAVRVHSGSTYAGWNAYVPKINLRPYVAPTQSEKAPPPASDRADSLLRIGQALESSSKVPAALDYYRRVIKEYPDTPAAGVAAIRIKALTPR